MFYPIHPSDSPEAKIGRKIYEEFDTVVILRKQHRIQDIPWKNFLSNLRNGTVADSEISMLRDLVIGSPNNEPVDFSSSEWSNASLVTPRHGVQNMWNEHATYKWCQSSGEQLFICDAEDTIKGRSLDNDEKYTLLTRKNDGTKQKRRKDLPNRLHLAKGMKVMVTTNIETDLDVANGARGQIVDIVLHPDEPDVTGQPIVKLKHLPSYILVKLERTRATPLEGLEGSVIPIEPALVKMQIKVPASNGGTVTRTVSVTSQSDRPYGLQYHLLTDLFLPFIFLTFPYSTNPSTGLRSPSRPYCLSIVPPLIIHSPRILVTLLLRNNSVVLTSD